MVFCNIDNIDVKIIERGHNPYFNRWFSAIPRHCQCFGSGNVTILILIDGFLQYNMFFKCSEVANVTILILIDGFLQFSSWLHIKFDEDKSQSLF